MPTVINWAFDKPAPATFDSSGATFDSGASPSPTPTPTPTPTPSPGFVSPTPSPYANFITSEHNQKLNFMALVATLCGSVYDATLATQSLVPAFDLNTAVGAQLDVIGLWIGQPRIIPGILIAGYFGFSELSSGLPDGLQLPFGELSSASIGGIFFELGGTAAATTTLTDPQYLTILKARIARNQSNGTLSALEGALFFIFGAGCKVVDNGTRSLAITVSTPISPVDQSLITGLDILPRPAGIGISSITFTP
jgi:hypothetical protein